MPVKISNPKQKTKTIRPLKDDDINEILIIADKLFGYNYLTKPEVQSYINDNDKISIVSGNDVEITGFQLMQIGKPENIIATMLSEQEWFRKLFSKHQLIGVLKTIAVKEECHNQGVGTLLTKKSLEILKKKTDFIISVCWDNNGENSITKILEKFNMKLIRQIDEYWKDDSIKKNYSCKICGAPPCRCNALIYGYLKASHNH